MKHDETIDDLTQAVGLTNPPLGAEALLRCFVAGVRWRDDGIDPTPTTGMRLEPIRGMSYWGDLSKIRFIAEAPGAILHINYVGHKRY